MPERDSAWLSGGVVDAEDARLATGSLVTAGNTPVQSRTGLRPAASAGRVSATVTPSGQVQVNAFQAVIQGTRSPNAGAYLVTLDQAKTIDVLGAVPAHPTYARFDLIVVRQTDTQYGDATSAMTVSLVAGTPAQAPVEPTVTGDVIVLARISVPAKATAIAPEQIQDRRFFTSSIGGVVPAHGEGNRPAVPYVGQLVYRQDLRTLEAYEGTMWKPAVANSLAVYGTPDPGFPIRGTSAGDLRYFNRLTVPAVYYPRSLLITAHTMVDSNGTADRYDVVLRTNGTVIAISVVNTPPGAGILTAHLTGSTSQPVNTAMTIEVGIHRVDGNGTVDTGYGGAYDSINVLAIPS
ncbi:hypothetical protein LWC34_02915 [Kibdelosporangium philippinense]|uniref:Uncharacterized protein n=1 Tax=Kibdelosporangium philippinense TaxID=211113 RepID=A0ABS8Z586_9PSEU|nr:hypothetical protein [Kibdelosporangium philippinense]MCE7001796.1 hypothetical protein [Kibdelosporangium philippinense]